MSFCIYLRKSRKDIEAEIHGEGETLARHEQALLSLAKRDNYNIEHIYKEIVSGDTISDRPQMQQLLSDIEHRRWEGVLVMDADRLARGDLSDQGRIAKTFHFTGTKIITPNQIFDPRSESDEQVFEFQLFMARFEYKMIKSRLKRGREASVREGKFVGNKAPYGYRRVKLQNEKGWTLEIVPEEAAVIQMIYRLYTVGELQPDGSTKRLGISLIVRKLNESGIKSKTGKSWIPATIRGILDNPVYIGKVRWNHRAVVQSMHQGEIIKSRPRAAEQDCIIVDGLHEAIIDQETWDLVHEYLAHPTIVPVPKAKEIQNPLAGLVVCAKCGRKMVRRPYGPRRSVDTIICPYTDCNNISSDLNLVEHKILDGLAGWIQGYELEWKQPKFNHSANMGVSTNDMQKQALIRLESEFAELEKRQSRIFDLLEDGTYTQEIFHQRIDKVRTDIDANREQQKMLRAEIQKELNYEQIRIAIVPKVTHLLAVYHTLPSAKAKNDMLKEVLEKVIYNKDKNGRWHNSPDDFEIKLFPKMAVNSKKKDFLTIVR